MKTDKVTAKALIIARFGMLECGKNFKGQLPQNCSQCDVLDNENHRLNFCIKWKHLNLYHAAVKIHFESVYSDNMETMMVILKEIMKVWNVVNGRGGMRV